MTTNTDPTTCPDCGGDCEVLLDAMIWHLAKPCARCGDRIIGETHYHRSYGDVCTSCDYDLVIGGRR